MHEPVKSQIENLVRGRVDPSAAAEVEAHLFACPPCAAELEAMRLQSGIMRLLRPAQRMDPAPGFYARVIHKIETGGKPGFWTLLLDPMFGRRLVYATGSLALLMAALLAATTPETPELAQSPVQILAAQPAAAPEAPETALEDMQQGRERFLVTLASFSD